MEGEEKKTTSQAKSTMIIISLSIFFVCSHPIENASFVSVCQVLFGFQDQFVLCAYINALEIIGIYTVCT